MKKQTVIAFMAGILLMSLPQTSAAKTLTATTSPTNNTTAGQAPHVTDGQTKGTQFFKGTVAEALAKAKAEGKMLMVDCYTLWCGPCRMMATKVFPDEKLGQFMNDHFVCLQLDMEHGEGPERNKTYQVKAYPTFIFFDADGQEKSRFEGMAMQDEFQKRCQRILEGKAPIDEEAEKAAMAQQPQPKAEKDTIIDEGKGVQFLKGSEVRLSEVLAQAKRENKRVLIDFWADWCHACIQMNKTVFRDTRVGNLMNYSFVNYAVNTDTDPDAKELLEKFDVHAFPTYLILNPDGTEYNRLVGSRGLVGDFAKSLTDALLGKEDESVMMERLQKEAMAKARAERQQNLTTTPRTAPKVKTKFVKGQDVEKAIKTAKAKKKNLLVFISDGDYKSDYMEKYGFDEAGVAGYLNQNFICLFVDAKSKQGDEIISKYNVEEQFPAYLLFDSKGECKGCAGGLLRGAKSTKEMLEMYLNYQPRN